MERITGNETLIKTKNEKRAFAIPAGITSMFNAL
jgi:hypothetical protein